MILDEHVDIELPVQKITDRAEAYRYILEHKCGYTKDLFEHIDAGLIRDFALVGYINI